MKRNVMPTPMVLLAVAAALQITACSKIVEWEEEVPLNTGDTIWVKRTATYTRSSAYANPLKPSWRIESETLVFEWAGKKFYWRGDAKLMVLAIDPQRRPALVANADWNYRWGDRHGYKCTKPYYVQFVPGQPDEWGWPPAIEPWLYGMEANLIIHRTDPDVMPRRISAAHRKQADADIQLRTESSQRIIPTYVPDHCKGKV